MSDIKTLNGHNLVDTAATAKLNSIIETVGGDTLTWDGDMTGHYVIENIETDLGAVNFVHISDSVPTADDVTTNLRISAAFSDGTIKSGEEILEASGFEEDGYGAIYMGLVTFIPYDNYQALDVNGSVLFEFAKKGAYFVEQEGYYISSLTIPGYTGFTTEKIKQDALPEALRFGREVAETEYLAETTLEYSESEGGYVAACPKVPIPGETYKVNWNGTVYDTLCAQIEANGATNIVIGNAGAAGIPGIDDTGEPFAAMFMYGAIVFFVIDTNFKDAVTVSVSGPAEVVNKLSSEFIDAKTTFYVGDSDKYVYKDIACTVKATKDDVVQAVKNTAIDLASGLYAAGGIEFRFSVLCVEAVNNYATLEVYSGGTSKYYTAEYTAT